MRPLPFVDPIAAVAFWTAYALFVLDEVWVLGRSRSSVATSHDEGSKRLMFVSIGVAILVGFLAGATLTGAAIGGLRWALLWIGVALGNWVSLVVGVGVPLVAILRRISVESGR